MLSSLVRQTLEIYIREKRVITQSDISPDLLLYASIKDAIFVTLYYDGKVIASSGRVQCKKENSLFECIDNTLMCLKDPRFTSALQSPDMIANIHIRVDQLTAAWRRMIQTPDEMNIRSEGIMILSQNFGTLAVILPNMIHLDPTPAKYFDLVCKKADLDPAKLTHADYVLYAISTTQSTDME